MLLSSYVRRSLTSTVMIYDVTVTMRRSLTCPPAGKRHHSGGPAAVAPEGGGEPRDAALWDHLHWGKRLSFNFNSNTILNSRWENVPKIRCMALNLLFKSLELCLVFCQFFFNLLSPRDRLLHRNSLTKPYYLSFLHIHDIVSHREVTQNRRVPSLSLNYTKSRCSNQLPWLLIG